MRFLPKNLNKNTGKVLEIMQKLKAGQIFALLEFLRTNSWDSPTAELLAESILLEKETLNWIFESENNEALFFNGSFSPDNKHVRLLRNRFLFARKLKNFSRQGQCYYARNNDILWNLLFSDLVSLDIDRKSHLFLNLKNYLECGHYEKALKNPELLSKIFYLYYCSLKNSPNVPAHFLLECLKIVRILNPVHPPSAIEYADNLKKNKKDAEALDIINNIYEKGCRDSGIIIKLIELLKKNGKQEKINLLAEQLFLQSLPQMKAEHFFQISDVLYENKNYTGSLFFQLRGISIQKENDKNYSELRRIFFRLHDFNSGNICHELYLSGSNAHYDETVFIVPPDLTGILKFKLSALEPWQKVDDELLFIPKTGNRVHVKFLSPENNEELYFFADNSGPYEIKLLEQKISVQYMETANHKSGRPEYRYCHHVFSPEPDSLRQLHKQTIFKPESGKPL
jgi:hypothetical protein